MNYIHLFDKEIDQGAALSRPVSAVTKANRGSDVKPSYFSQRAANHRAEYVWVAVTLFIFALQTIPYLSYRWVTDESWYAGPASSIAQGHGVRDPAIGPNDIENHFDARPPGTAVAIAVMFKTFGIGPAVARFGSVLGGLVAIWLMYGLARDFLGWQAAIVASLLLATDNLLVLASRSARPEALTVMAVLLALTALKQYAARGTMRWALAAGLLMAFATMFHVTILGYIVAGGFMMLVLDRMHHRFIARGALCYTAGFFAGLIPFATWILTAPLGRAGFRAEFLSRAVNTTLLEKFLAEGRRYSDILGLSMLHGHGLESIPVRLPIPLCFLAATVLLWRVRRNWFYVEMMLLLPSVLWLIYTVNKSSRYVAILAPIFAMTLAAAVACTRERRTLHRVALAVAGVIIVAQAGANAVLLRAASKANYEKAGAQLRALIPPTETAYGAIAFWLAFHDQTFISYERTSPWMAARQYNTRYFILGDKVMVNGYAGNDDFYRQLNQDMGEIAAHSTLVGRVDDPYYGNLSVYKLQSDEDAK